MLATILSSRIRAEIFRLLFGPSPLDLHVREIERRSGLSLGTVRQELRKLERLDLLQSRPDGNRLYYRANPLHPLYSVIRDLVVKTAGLVEVLKGALAGLDIDLAWVFGSVARRNEGAESDVDLMVVGRAGLRELTAALQPATDKIGREVSPYVMSPAEFTHRLQQRDHFLRGVLDSERLFVIGSPDELESMAGLRLADRPPNQPG